MTESMKYYESIRRKYAHKMSKSIIVINPASLEVTQE